MRGNWLGYSETTKSCPELESAGMPVSWPGESFYGQTRQRLGSLAPMTNLTTLYQLSSMVAVASCSETALLPVSLVHYTKWMEF